jgi:methylenetetrahydrofolate dehydrogenase (NADP+)/methenyltetrahydrofolate cyclohydrolase
MKFDGRAFAQEIYQDLSADITRLKEQGITPRLVVILVGQNPNSLSYIKQKVKWGDAIGAEIVVNEFPENIDEQTMLEKIQELNTDSATHGIIVQLPLPPHLDENVLTQAVFREKDIDGFHIDSPYTVPVAQAVLSILQKIHPSDFMAWLGKEKIVVLGKGKTAGHPIIELLSKMDLSPIVIDHATPNPEHLTQEADIIISCVGKVILRKEIVKKDAIVIGVGRELLPEQYYRQSYYL